MKILGKGKLARRGAQSTPRLLDQKEVVLSAVWDAPKTDQAARRAVGRVLQKHTHNRYLHVRIHFVQRGDEVAGFRLLCTSPRAERTLPPDIVAKRMQAFVEDMRETCPLVIASCGTFLRPPDLFLLHADGVSSMFDDASYLPLHSQSTEGITLFDQAKMASAARKKPRSNTWPARGFGKYTFPLVLDAHIELAAHPTYRMFVGALSSSLDGMPWVDFGVFRSVGENDRARITFRAIDREALHCGSPDGFLHKVVSWLRGVHPKNFVEFRVNFGLYHGHHTLALHRFVRAKDGLDLRSLFPKGVLYAERELGEINVDYHSPLLEGEDEKTPNLL